MDQWSKQVKASGAQPTGAEIRPAATACILRDHEGGLEVLMVQRATKLDFHGGAWVFPGGRIDPEDARDTDDDIISAARRAAVRETQEEAGIVVDEQSLVHVSNWTTPEISPKRFATWFFAGPAGDDHAGALADGVESDAVRWYPPQVALAERAGGEIELAPPQFVTLLSLSRFQTVRDALTVLDAEDPIDFQPRFHFLEHGDTIITYAGDVAYDDFDRLREPGPRHRLLMGRSGWMYEQDC